jgi:pilus assembly protein CpaB
MKPARIAVICIAAVSAIGLALVVRAMGSSSGEAVATASAEPAAPMAKVLVAARDLAPGQRLTDADLEWKDWPAAEVNPAFITDGSVPVPRPATAEGEAEKAEAEKPADESAGARVTRAVTELATGGAEADYYGSVVREPILAGEPIVGRKIVRAGDSGYMAAYLEPGMRAMSIGVSVETAAGGFILPGDRVDVLVTVELQDNGEGGGQTRYASSIVLQNVKVLAVDQSTRAEDDQQAVVGATATLEVSPSDSEALALAKAAGELSLVLRSYADTAGPSGRVQPLPRGRATPQTASVRIYRGGEPETVTVQ